LGVRKSLCATSWAMSCNKSVVDNKTWVKSRKYRGGAGGETDKNEQQARERKPSVKLKATRKKRHSRGYLMAPAVS
jgi:hypothetical protein